MAQRGINIQARTAGELADLCAANPKDAQGDAKINFCLGFAQGAITANSATPRARSVLLPEPGANTHRHHDAVL